MKFQDSIDCFFSHRYLVDGFITLRENILLLLVEVEGYLKLVEVKWWILWTAHKYDMPIGVTLMERIFIAFGISSNIKSPEVKNWKIREHDIAKKEWWMLLILGVGIYYIASYRSGRGQKSSEVTGGETTKNLGNCLWTPYLKIQMIDNFHTWYMEL